MTAKKSESRDAAKVPHYRKTTRFYKSMKTVVMPSLFLLLAAVVRGQSALDGFDPNADGAVRVVAVQPDGKILLGGEFTTLAPNGGAAVTRNYIARLNADGTLDSAFNPDANTFVRSIVVQPDGKILVGGDFAVIGGQPRNRMARLDATTGLADSFAPNANNSVASIAVQPDGKIVAGGYFTSIGGEMRNYIARLDATTGAADSFNPSANNAVRSITLQTDGKILAGGDFFGANGIGGQTRNYIARLDATTGSADSFNPNANNYVTSITVQADGRILVGGFFNQSFGVNTIGGQTRNYIARLDATSGLADSFNPNANGLVTSIALQADGKILAGGFFTGFNSIGGQTRGRVARLDAATGLADSFNPNADNQVNSIAVQTNGKILVGGKFTTFAPNEEPPVTRNRIARLENMPATPTPTPGACGWNEAPRYPVPIAGHAVTSLGTNLYSFGGGQLQPIAPPCFKFDGTTWTSIAQLPVFVAGARAVNDGTNIYVLGGSTLSSSTPVNTLRKYDPVTNSYATLAPFATPTFFHAAVYLDGKIYKFGGYSFQNLPTNALEIYDIATNTWTGGANYPLAMGSMSAFAHGNFIYAAGGHNFDAGAKANTYRYDPATNTWDDAAIADLPVRRSQAVAAFYNGGWVLAGGEVGGGPGGGTVTASVISWNPASNTWSTLPSMLGGRVANGAVLNGSFYVVGGRDQTLTNDNQKLTCNPGSSPTPTPTPTTLGNISTRLRVETDDNVLIGGFIVTGTQPKRIIVRAIGPSLPLAGTLADPFLELRNASGGLIASNDNWRFGGHEVEIIATTIPPSHDLEAAIVATLPANGSAYTAIVRGVDNGTGIGVVEAYDLDRTVDSKLANISTRGLVQTGDDVMIGGLIVLGQNPLRVIVRALGPSLPLPGPLGDPTLNLHDGNGTVIASNDNWRDDPAQEAEIIGTGIPPSNNLESAIVRNLAPGNYTAIVRGVNNTTGVAVVEAYGLN